jgi:hypothetical protein
MNADSQTCNGEQFCRLCIRQSRSLFVSLLVTLWAVSAFAAPPKVDFLFPAGAARGTTVSVAAQGTFEKWPVQAWCDRRGVTVVPAQEKGKLAITIPAETEPGVCWIRLYDADGASVQKPFVIGLLPEIVETEPNNEPSKPQAIEIPNVTVNGQLEKAQDVDYFSVALKQGQTLIASTEAHRTLGSPMDGVLQIVSPQGFILEHNDDNHGLDPQIVFRIPADGRYLVRAMAFPAETGANIALSGGPNYVYRLTLTTGAFVDHVWPLAASMSAPATVKVFGWNIPETSTHIPLSVSADKVHVTLFAPQLANSILLPVMPHAIAVEDQPAGARGPQDLQFPVTLTGRVANLRETDAYRVSLKKGEALHIRVEARQLGSPLDPVLTVADSSGMTIQQVDDVQTSRDAELTFTAPADGAFQINVTDLHRRGDWQFVYRMTVARPQPDFSASVTADTFTLTAGTPLEIPVTIDRAGSFAEEIEFTIAGLPTGVAASPVKSLPQGDSAKTVKIVLTGGPGPSSGAFSIVGKSSGDFNFARPAQASLAGSARSSELWLTVLPAVQK